MRMTKYLSLLGTLFFLSSCAVGFDDEITVTKNRSAGVNIRVVDPEGNPLEASEISIFEYSYQLQQGKTDASGYYFGEKLLEGLYSYKIKAQKGKVSYLDEGVISIIAKNEDVIEINPLGNTGTFDIAVVDKEAGTPISNPEDYGIALLEFPDGNFSSVEKLKEDAHFIADLDSNGKTLIKYIPSAKGYAFYLFDKTKDQYTRFLVYNVFKGQKRDIILQKY